MKEQWNKKYSSEMYAYGEQPNVFFKDELDKLPCGKILLPADGEGRNGVYAASKGWQVESFDMSETGREKAMRLAEKMGVEINYRILEIQHMAQTYAKESFDAIALIYSHVPLPIKEITFSQLTELLKPSGKIILEGFSKKHVEYQKKNPGIGGPPDVNMLYSVDEIRCFLPEITFLKLSEEEIRLNEGNSHNGVGSVIRMVGVKG